MATEAEKDREFSLRARAIANVDVARDALLELTPEDQARAYTLKIVADSLREIQHQSMSQFE